MSIDMLTREECFGLMARSQLARLACASAGQPYVVPINYVLDGDGLYSFTTFGRKVDWMRSNPKVCIEIDDIAHNRSWESVVATGHYEELTDTPQLARDRHRAWALLQTRPNWWEPGYVKTVISGVDRPLTPIFFRILLKEVTGHRLAVPGPTPTRDRASVAGFMRLLLGNRQPSASRAEKTPT